jgi:hypothetical protein
MQQFVNEGFFPFIARVGWNDGSGHFVVCTKTTSKGHLVCLDPWYGLVQAPLANLPAYSVQADSRSRRSLLNAIGGILSGHVIYPNATKA